jgi:hypothetical protein
LADITFTTDDLQALGRKLDGVTQLDEPPTPIKG